MVKEVYIDNTIKDISIDIKNKEDFLVKDKNERIVGVLSNEKALKYLLNPDTKIEKIYVKMKPIDYTNDLKYLAKRFLDYNTRVILLNKDNKIIAYTIFDLLNEILEKDGNILSQYKSEQVMKEPVTINYKEDIEKALGLMRFKGVSRLIVVDDDNNAVGILSISDIIRFFSEENKEKTIYEEKDKIEIRSIISNKLIFSNKDDDLKKVSELLLNNKIFSVPVLDNNKPVGIITLKDLLAFYFAIKSEKDVKVIVHGINLDEEDIKHFNEKFENLIRKYESIIGGNAKLIVYVKKIKEYKKFLRKYVYFIIKSKFISDKILLNADTESVGLYEGFNEILKILENQLERRKNRNKKEYFIERINKEYFEYI